MIAPIIVATLALIAYLALNIGYLIKSIDDQKKLDKEYRADIESLRVGR
jgi:hypothetical protein